ncbi:MAG: hypothetical protein AB7V62_13240 [Thermoleophilia bacterium]
MTTPGPSAAERAAATVARVRDDPAARLRLGRVLYASEPPGSPHLPYGRAMASFIGWQVRRGVLAPPGAPRPGSPWWRALNEAVLRDIAEARQLEAGAPGQPSSPAVEAILAFIARPTAAGWYRAHNVSIARAYLANAGLAQGEGRIERFFLNVVLLRVLYAHALVAAPRLALGWMWPLGRPLGDPRASTTGIFLSLARTVPDRYPLGDDVTPFVAGEASLGRMLDRAMIQPRLRALYDWSARELGEPGVARLLDGDVPAYAWDPADAATWAPPDKRLDRLVRRIVPPPMSPPGGPRR